MVTKLGLTIGALLLALVVWGCDDGSGDEADVMSEIQMLDPQPFTLALEANYGGRESHSVNGTDFDIELTEAYLIVGNLSVVGPGEPMPSYHAMSEGMDPLGVGENSIDGYQVVDLFASPELGPVMVPGGWAGPVVFAYLSDDGSVTPLTNDFMDISTRNYAMVVVGTLYIGAVERRVELYIADDLLNIQGAPAFEATRPRTLRMTYDFNNWFEAVDANLLSHVANVIQIDASTNTDAHDILIVKASDALRSPTISWE